MRGKSSCRKHNIHSRQPPEHPKPAPIDVNFDDVTTTTLRFGGNQLINFDPDNVKDKYSPHLNHFIIIFMKIFSIQMCLFSLSSKRLLVSRWSPNFENRSVCKRRDIYFHNSALLNLRQYIVGLYASTLDRQANQNACFKQIALDFFNRITISDH